MCGADQPYGCVSLPDDCFHTVDTCVSLCAPYGEAYQCGTNVPTTTSGHPPTIPPTPPTPPAVPTGCPSSGCGSSYGPPIGAVFEIVIPAICVMMAIYGYCKGWCTSKPMRPNPVATRGGTVLASPAIAERPPQRQTQQQQASTSPWYCGQCTFTNNASDQTCQACGGSKAHSDLVTRLRQAIAIDPEARLQEVLNREAQLRYASTIPVATVQQAKAGDPDARPEGVNPDAQLKDDLTIPVARVV